VRAPENSEVIMKPAVKPASVQPALARRKLLGAAGTTGALVAGATLFATRDDTPAQVETDAKAAPDKGGGYRLSEHVQRYYQTAKV